MLAVLEFDGLDVDPLTFGVAILRIGLLLCWSTLFWSRSSSAFLLLLDEGVAELLVGGGRLGTEDENKLEVGRGAMLAPLVWISVEVGAACDLSGEVAFRKGEGARLLCAAVACGAAVLGGGTVLW